MRSYILLKMLRRNCQRLKNKLPKNASLTLCKTFKMHNLDYRDVVYDQPNNESFCRKLEKNQYHAALAISGFIKCTLLAKRHDELCLEFRKRRKGLGVYVHFIK